MTFGVAQVGLALLLRPLLARWMRRPVAWAAVAMANLSAMTLFLWHQTAFLAVTMGGLLIGRLPGLHTAPVGYLWVAERLAWLPVFAVALAALWFVFRHAERAPRPKAGPANRGAPRSQRTSSGHPGRAEYHRGPGPGTLPDASRTSPGQVDAGPEYDHRTGAVHPCRVVRAGRTRSY